MKQNVKGSTAAIIIAVAIVVFFVGFSKLQGPPEAPPFIMPETPPVAQGEVEEMYRGMSPLGIAVVVPALVEDRMRGTRVSGVLVDSPAAKAGVHVGDLITKFEGRPIPSKDALMYYLEQVDLGKTYPLVVNRAGKELKLKVTGLAPLAPEERVRF